MTSEMAIIDICVVVLPIFKGKDCSQAVNIWSRMQDIHFHETI